MTKENRAALAHIKRVLETLADEYDAVIGSPLGGTLLREAAKIQAVLDSEFVTPEPTPKFFDGMGGNDE